MVFTNTQGDCGITNSMVTNNMPKDDCLIEVNGVLDGVMSQLDKVIYELHTDNQLLDLILIQDSLRHVGGEIAGIKNTHITYKNVATIEAAIVVLNISVNTFITFKNILSMEINELRVRVRKLERVLTPYLRSGIISKSTYAYINRLSKYFFTLAVYFNN